MFRRLIGWMANLYPNHVFYSKQFMPWLRMENTDGNAVSLAVAIAASRVLEPGEVYRDEFTAVMDGGRNVGDYTITIERHESIAGHPDYKKNSDND